MPEIYNQTFSAYNGAVPPVGAGQSIAGLTDRLGNVGQVTSAGRLLVSHPGNGAGRFNEQLLIPNSNNYLNGSITVRIPANQPDHTCTSVQARAQTYTGLANGFWASYELAYFDSPAQGANAMRLVINTADYGQTELKTGTFARDPAKAYDLQLAFTGANPTVLVCKLIDVATGQTKETLTVNDSHPEVQGAGYSTIVASQEASYGQAATFELLSVKATAVAAQAAMTVPIPTLISRTGTSVTLRCNNVNGIGTVTYDVYMAVNRADKAVNGAYTKVKTAVADNAEFTVSGLTPGTLYAFYAVATDSRAAGDGGPQTVTSNDARYDFYQLVETERPAAGAYPPLVSWANSGIVYFYCGDSNAEGNGINAAVAKLVAAGVTGTIIPVLFNWPSSAIGVDWLSTSNFIIDHDPNATEPAFPRGTPRPADNGGVGNASTDNIYTFLSKEIDAQRAAHPSYTIIVDIGMSANDPRQNITGSKFAAAYTGIKNLIASKTNTKLVITAQPMLYLSGGGTAANVDFLLAERTAGQTVVDGVTAFAGDTSFLYDDYTHPAYRTLQDGTFDGIHLAVAGYTAWGTARGEAMRRGILADGSSGGNGGSGGSGEVVLSDAAIAALVQAIWAFPTPDDLSETPIGETLALAAGWAQAANGNAATLLGKFPQPTMDKINGAQQAGSQVTLPNPAPSGYGGGGGLTSDQSNKLTDLWNRLTPTRAGLLDLLTPLKTGVDNLLSMTEVVSNVRRFLATALAQSPSYGDGGSGGSDGYDLPDVQYKGTNLNQSSFSRAGRQLLAVTILADGGDYPVRTSKSRMYLGFVPSTETEYPAVADCTEVKPHGQGNQVQARILLGTSDGTETMPIVNLAPGMWKACVWIKDVEIEPLFTQAFTVTA